MDNDPWYDPEYKEREPKLLETRDLDYIIQAHTQHSRTPNKAIRKFDGETPYHYHPIWCSTTIATETTLPKELRNRGSQVLLYHDVPEDTTAELPDWLTPEVIKDIADMTYESSDHEMREIWDKPVHIKLFKLYDKVHNLLDGAWMTPEKRKKYLDYTIKLCDLAEREYGTLNITKIARALITN